MTTLEALRLELRKRRDAARLIPGLLPVLDLLEAHLIRQAESIVYLERAQELTARDLTKLECRLAVLEGHR